MSDSLADVAARLEALRRSSTPPTVEEAASEAMAAHDLSPEAVWSRLDELRALWRMTAALRGKVAARTAR